MRVDVIVKFRTKSDYDSGLIREKLIRRALTSDVVLSSVISRKSLTPRGKYPKTVLFKLNVLRRKYRKK